jgi:rhodanese-related sulfurtransferase
MRFSMRQVPPEQRKLTPHLQGPSASDVSLPSGLKNCMHIHSIALKGIARNTHAVSDGKGITLIDPGLAAVEEYKQLEGPLQAVVLTSVPADRISAHRILQTSVPGLKLFMPAREAQGWNTLDVNGLSALSLNATQSILRLTDVDGKVQAYFTGVAAPEQLEYITELDRDQVAVYSAFGLYPSLNAWAELQYAEASFPSIPLEHYNLSRADLQLVYPLTVKQLDAASVQQFSSDGSLVLDMRAAEQFADGHVPGSLNLPPGAAFLRNIHRIIDLDRRFLVVCDAENKDECMAALAETGLTGAEGYWLFDAEEWTRSGDRLDMLVWVDEEELGLDMRFSIPQLIDTRAEAAFNAGALENAQSIPPETFDDEDGLPAGEHDLYFYCHDGGNSFLFASMLKARGMHRLRVLLGGLQAAPSLWQNGPVPQATNSNPN